MTCSSTFRTHQIVTVLRSASETTVHVPLYVIRSLGVVVEIANQSESTTDFRGRVCNGVFFHQPSALRSRAIMDYVPAASDNRGSVLSSSLCTIVRLRNRATSEAAFSLYCWRDAPLFTALIFFRGDDGMAVWCSHKKAVNLPCVYRVRVAFDDVALHHHWMWDANNWSSACVKSSRFDVFRCDFFSSVTVGKPLDSCRCTWRPFVHLAYCIFIISCNATSSLLLASYRVDKLLVLSCWILLVQDSRVVKWVVVDWFSWAWNSCY